MYLTIEDDGEQHIVLDLREFDALDPADESQLEELRTMFENALVEFFDL